MLRLAALGMLLVVAAVVSESLASREDHSVRLRVAVSGSGTVQGPGKRVCRKRCSWSFRRGSVVRVRANPLRGGRFLGWRGACAGRRGCMVKLTRERRIGARFSSREIGSLTSWNPHVDCVPTKTTIPEILGSEPGPTGGATEAGGAFKPHLENDPQRHLLNPPCDVEGEPAFVQIDGVVVSGDVDHPPDGDVTTNLTDASRPDIPNRNMKTIHAEIDATWFSANVAPAAFPPAGSKIDVQGFVFWDPGNEGHDWHSYSGWELHPVSAWFPSRR